mgnify:CR=1 FL=1
MTANSYSQQVIFTPDLVLGHRSVMYKHIISGQTKNKKYAFNNLSLFDTEYNDDSKNIFFIRNTVSVKLNNTLSFNSSIGIKNPGAFLTLAFKYTHAKKHLSYSYSVGTTYQSKFSLEQSLYINYEPPLGSALHWHFNALAVGNLNNDGYIRGLQQIKLGVKKQNTMAGVAGNFDQFKNATSTLLNIGLFIKQNF